MAFEVVGRVAHRRSLAAAAGEARPIQRERIATLEVEVAVLVDLLPNSEGCVITLGRLELHLDEGATGRAELEDGGDPLLGLLGSVSLDCAGSSRGESLLGLGRSEER